MAQIVDTSDLRPGMKIKWEGGMWTILECSHHKMGRGGAIVRGKLRNLETGSGVEQSFKSGERFERIVFDEKPAQFQYRDGDHYVFMDMESYDQVYLSTEALGDAVKYLVDNLEVQFEMYEGRVMGVELPNSVTMKIVETPPGFKGDTASGERQARHPGDGLGGDGALLHRERGGHRGGYPHGGIPRAGQEVGTRNRKGEVTMAAREKIAYLKGLIDGQKPADPDTAKLLGAMVDALDALADDLENQGIRLEEHREILDEVSEYLDQIDEDLCALEDRIESCEDEEEDDDEEEDYISVCCPHCRKDFFYDPAAYEEDEDLLCPHCGEPFKQPEA